MVTQVEALTQLGRGEIMFALSPLLTVIAVNTAYAKLDILELYS